MGSAEIKLYGHYDSGHVYKVALFLALAGIDYHYEHVDIWIDKSERQSQFLVHSRNAEVPCLLLDGDAYIQSNVILQLLAKRYKCYGGESEAALLAAMDWQFWEANRLGMCLPQLRYARAFAADEFTTDSLAFLTQRFEADIALLASVFMDSRDFILGAEPSIADCSICGYLFWAEEAGVTLPEEISRWLQRISLLNGWQDPYTLLGKSTYA